MQVRLFDVSVDHLGVVSDALEMIAVDVDEARDGLVVEHLADNVEVSSDGQRKDAGLAVGQCEAADLLLAEHHEVCKYTRSETLVVAVDDGVRVELSAAAGSHELEFPSVLASGKHQALSRVSAHT